MERVIVQFLRGAKAGQTEIFPVGRFDRISFGRDPGCDVRFDPERDDLVSRHHAGLEWDSSNPRVYVLTDLLSSNGTFLNGRRVQEPVEVRDGDEIEFGGMRGPCVRIGLERIDPQTLPSSRVTQTVPLVRVPEDWPGQGSVGPTLTGFSRKD